ncbi:MAG TPA: DEAD/DEAH box helicase [Acidimicrobiales bacterium]|nr:DEAD/DEAH box helicase [Acidimicrobiales bacterium]
MTVSFADLGVRPELVSRLHARGLTAPFPIQRATLPDALDGRDVCGRAPTGSGKTLAFGLAVVSRTNGSKPGRPGALILVPTRELAAQVQREVSLLCGKGHGRVIAVYGGTGYRATRQALSRGVDIVVACPGRLEDLVAQGAIDLGAVRTAVVDEADRMADMGFLPAVRRLLDRTAPDRQVLLFSATMGPEVETLVARYQTNPARHDVENDEPCDSDVSHLFWSVPRHERVPVTVALVGEHGRALVFCRTRRGADRVTGQLNAGGVKALAIHGGKTQAQRERALGAFAEGRARALVATDVAARGIHVEDLPCVVHYDPPADHTDYLHRSGRTGRAGKTGIVVSLVADEQVPANKVLQRSLGFATVLHAREASKSVGQGSRVATLGSVERPRVGTSTSPRGSITSSPRRPRSDVGRRSDGAPVGTVKFFDAKRGYGFLSRPDGTGDVFVHASSIQGIGPSVLRPGQQVRFQMTTGRKGDEACNVMVI